MASDRDGRAGVWLAWVWGLVAHSALTPFVWAVFAMFAYTQGWWVGGIAASVMTVLEIVYHWVLPITDTTRSTP